MVNRRRAVFKGSFSSSKSTGVAGATVILLSRGINIHGNRFVWVRWIELSVKLT